jgi:Zn-dependent protease
MGFGLDLATILTNIIILLIAFPVHEFAHAWAATMFGDDTPKILGRLTLNPIRHLDLMGSLMLLFAGFGWAKPVPVNGAALQRRSPSALMWVSLAGPLSNLLMALIAVVPIRFNLVTLDPTQFSSTIPTLGQFLFFFIYINLLLAFFNMIPLYPLDGEKIFTHFLPDKIAQSLYNIRPYQPFILLGVVFIGSRTGWLYAPLNWLFGILIG